MERQQVIRLIKTLETRYKTDKSFIPLSTIAESTEDANYILNGNGLFFAVSKSRIIMIHWLCREIRRVYESVSFVPIDFGNEVYEALRLAFKTRALNKAKLLSIFDIKNNKIIPFEVFEEYESKYIKIYNGIVPNEMKLPEIKHIFIPDRTKAEDLNEELDKILNRNRVFDVLHSRAKGETLDSIGSRYGITRERARQIEIRPRELVERWMDKRSSQLIAIFGGDIIANNKKAKEYFGEDKWQILKYCAGTKESQKFSSWSYIPELDTICYSKTINENLDDILQSCADKNKSIDYTISKLKESGINITNEKILNKVCNSRKIHIYDGDLYPNKLNVGKGIIAAVTTEFKDGINISDKEQMKKFAEYMNEKYGLSVKPDRALTARIQDILVMSGKATYKSPDYIYPSKALDTAIKNYVESISDDRINYKTVFNEIDKDLMKECGITTFQGLHGYIKKNEKRIGVISLRYYVCKAGVTALKSKDFFEKFYNWLKDLGRPAGLDEILDNFDGWNDMYPKYAMLYYPQIVQWGQGTYMNMDVFNIPEDIIEKARKVLIENMNNKIHYTNSYILTAQLKNKVPDFINNPLVKNESHVFNLAKYYLYDDKILFTKPHIVSKDAIGGKEFFTTEDFIYLIIGKKNQICKPELMKEVLRCYGQKNSSLCLGVQHILKDFIRIDTDQYFKKSAIKISNDDINKIDEFIEKHMANDMYIVPDKLCDFSELPKLQFRWNSWALCSVIEMFSKKYKTLYKRNNIMQNCIVVVEKNSVYKTREQLAAYILTNMYDGPRDRDSIAKHLRSLGLFAQTINFNEIEAEEKKIEATKAS